MQRQLEERDHQMAVLKARLEARDAELKEVTEGMNKQIRKMKRDIKKLKKAAKDKSPNGEKKKKTKREGDAVEKKRNSAKVN